MREHGKDRWSRYRDAALANAGRTQHEEARASLLGSLRDRAARLWEGDPPVLLAPGRWRDLRLVPLGAGAWLGAAMGPYLGPAAGGVAVALTAAILAAAAGAVSARLAARRGRRTPPRRTLERLVLLSCTLTALVAGLAAAQWHAAAVSAGPAGELLARGGATVATVEVLGDPRPQRSVGAFLSGPRYGADARLVHATDEGRAFTASAPVRLVGGPGIAGLRAGATVEVAGTVVPPGQPGRAALLTVSNRPRPAGPDDGTLVLLGTIRESLRGASGWLSADAAGLLPGMTVGDTAALPPDLEDDMRSVGLGHLTAVSGSNFTILLGAVLLALRTLRAPRWLAASGCVAAIASLAAIVGPEPSVARAAAMGCVGLAALVSGRPGRSCSSLSAAVLVLVLLDPVVALSTGFLLSVAATLGIALLAEPLARLLGATVPPWLALSIAVPLSAQLMCGPLIVLIQPSFLTLSLAANVAVTPFVPLVTLAGTLALATSFWCPPAAFAATAVGGAAAQSVAGVARVLASAPGAVLPWPEGPAGAGAMAVVSGLNAAVLWLAALPAGRAAAVRFCRAALDAASGFGWSARRGRVDR